MEYMSVEEAAQKWGISIRSVQLHCQKGNVVGAILRGRSWGIPVSAARPKRKPRAKGRPSTILAALNPTFHVREQNPSGCWVFALRSSLHSRFRRVGSFA